MILVIYGRSFVINDYKKFVAHNAAFGGRNFWQNNEWSNFITRSLHSDYEI